MKITKSKLKQIIKEELDNILNQPKLDGYDYGFRGDERLEFNNAIRKNPDAARKVARMSVEEVSDWWEEYKKVSRGYEAPPGDPGPRRAILMTILLAKKEDIVIANMAMKSDA